ncbi:hypothetical protein MSC49_31700 [Methylosinus sp. C49]|uniref:class I SAM-dependent methyltransferase n=1 Tax=Methylosinus sp. C49 TaxID=2699395 RepID=UPI001367487E|nr:class I SAM-dependent methyltransferase [Methylosinus sp. C49]BBU63235.1 hypothetical protein MSC49_31700 [Methylosinus sp. C49]
MAVVVTLNEWINKNAPALKNVMRAVIPRVMRDAFAQKKFKELIKSESYAETFSNIYDRNWWGSAESISGCGSELARTSQVRDGLVKFIESHNIRTLIDAPCGDCNWIVDVIKTTKIIYFGYDIVPKLVENNRLAFPQYEFDVADILNMKLKPSDAWLCRDALFHFPNDAVFRVLEAFEKSDVKFLLTTHFKSVKFHTDIEFGQYRPINICCEPFNWPEPDHLIYDGDDKDTDRYLGVWVNPSLRVSASLDSNT